MKTFIFDLCMVLLLGLTVVAAEETILALTPLTATEGTPYSGTLLLAGTGIGTLEFRLIEGPAGMTINPATGSLSWIPATSQGGDQEIVLSVTDNGDGITTLFRETIHVTLLPEGFVTLTDVEANGVDVLVPGASLSTERGQDLTIRIQFVAETNDDRVKVKAWVGGFEFGDVSDITEIFTIKKGATYVKILNLEIPEDIELDDEDFTLHIEVFGTNDVSREETFSLALQKVRHHLNIIDVLFFPGNTVEAGRVLTTSVRVENLGEQKEEDILVKVSIPELGIKTSSFIDELASAKEVDDDDEETSNSSPDLVLFIPKDALSGEYVVEIQVEFNRGHDVITEKKSIFIEGDRSKGIKDELKEKVEALISVDMSSQNIAQDAEVPYKLMVANLGNKKMLYSVEASGMSGWGISRITPSFVSIEPGEAGEFFIFARANDNAPLGQQTFTVKLSADDIEVRSLTLNANIIEKGRAERIGFVGLQKALEIGFIILVIILVILGLIIAFRRIGEKPAESRDEPEVLEGQTYY